MSSSTDAYVQGLSPPMTKSLSKGAGLGHLGRLSHANGQDEETPIQVAEEIRKWDSMQRSDFNSATEYLDAILAQRTILERCGMEPRPFWILVKIIDNLEGEVRKIDFINEWIMLIDTSAKPRDMTFPEFLTLFNEIRDATTASR